jgi:hypothetical protein
MLARRLTLVLLSIGLLGCKTDNEPRREGKAHPQKAPEEEKLEFDREAAKQLGFSRAGGRGAALGRTAPDTTPDTRSERLVLAAREADPASTGDRTITFVNNCAEPIWVAANSNTTDGGWAMNAAADCTTAGCPAGQTCDSTSKTCQLSISVPGNFSGRFWPRTDCEFDSDGVCPTNSAGVSTNCCATGGCTASDGKTWSLECGGGGQAPTTVFEATFQANASDFYDVSVIDGFNVPIAVVPNGDFTKCSSDVENACDYWCTNPGGTSSSNDLGSCSWTKVLDATCAGHTELRTVDAASCTSNADCTAPSTCNLGTNTCQCTSDAGCAEGQICGIGNNEIIGYSVCGEFAGCTTPKAVCGIGAYFDHAEGGQACTSGADCASGTCNDSVCTASPADPFDCNDVHSGSVACSATSDCPLLVGIEFADQAACTCPTNTACSAIDPDDPNSKWSCRTTCMKGSCTSMACTTDADCLTLASGAATGTFLLCDTSAGSPTQGQCVSTNASLYEATGTNGETCYSNSGDVSGITTLCDGCPTASNAKNGGFWTNPTASCQADNGNWQAEVLPWLTAFKQACPTAYSFPFDDVTSTFQCQTTGAVNQVGYTITFCPAGS